MGTRTPFMRFSWQRYWWRHFGSAYQLAIGVLEDMKQQPVAIAPLMIGRDQNRAKGMLRCLSWIGGLGNADGERMDFIVPAGQEAELMPELLKVFSLLHQYWGMIWLGKMPEETATMPYVIEELEKIATGFAVRERLACHYVSLEGGWTEYEKRQSSRWRRNLKNRRNAYWDELGGKAGLAGKDMQVDMAIEKLALLHAMHWPEGVSNFLANETWPFHRAVAREWLLTGRAVMPYLALGDQMVAAAYGFVERGKFMLFQQGWDPAHKKISIGNLGIYQTFEYCLQHGVDVYDMLPGEYRYKSEWCPQKRYLVCLEAYAPESIMARSYQLMRKLERMFHSKQPGTSMTDAPATPGDGL
jgi:CelD/BcsL family acetyltransferase involved in cellulose biosynthesis